MFPNSLITSARTRFLLNLSLPDLEIQFRQKVIDQRDYPQIIKEMVAEYQACKQQIAFLQSQKSEKIFSACQELKYADQMTQKVIEMNISLFEQQKQALKNQYEQGLRNVDLLQEKQEQINELTRRIAQMNQLPQRLLWIDEAQQTQFLRQLEQQWNNVYQQSLSVQQEIITLMSNNTQNNSDNFIQCQPKISNNKIVEFERLVQQQKQIILQAEGLKGSLNRLNQDKESQINLQQAYQVLSHCISIMKKSLELWQYVIEENQSIKNSNQKLQEQNQRLAIEINRITQKHVDDVKKLRSDFDQIKEDLQNQTTMEFIRNSLTSNQIQTLSCIIQILLLEKSLEIHRQFYQTIKNDLDKVALKFTEISINNILGSFLSISNPQHNLEDKQNAILQIGEFQRQINQENGISMQVYINNGIQLLRVFEPFFASDNLDNKAKFFTRSYNNSYNALKSLQNYLESIAQGVQKFEEQHAILKNLEPARQ